MHGIYVYIVRIVRIYIYACACVYNLYLFPCLTCISQRLQSSTFLGLPYRILNMSPKKELLWSLRVTPQNREPLNQCQLC